MIERLQAFHAVKSMNDVRSEFGWQCIANELVNSVCIVSDEYFRLFLLHQKSPLSTHLIGPTALKMRSDLKRSRSQQELTSSWLISAWISKKILSQLIADVAPLRWRHDISISLYLKLGEPLCRGRQWRAFAHDVHCQNLGAARAALGVAEKRLGQ